MAAGLINAGLGAASLMSGKKGQKKAEGQANAAGARSLALEQRMTKLWDLLFKRAEDAEKSGQFDPEKRIAALEKDTARYESRDMGNLGGAMAVAGYKPGDSEIGTRMDAVKVKYRSFLDNMREQIRQSSFWDQTRAYQSAGDLMGPMQNANQQQQNAYAQMPQGGGNFLQNLIGSFGNRPGSTPRPMGFNIRRPGSSPAF